MTSFPLPATEDFDKKVALVELVDFLAQQTWSNFAQSLVKFYDDRGFLSDKQIAAAEKLRTKVNAGPAKAAAEAATATVSDGYEPAVNDVHVIDGDIFRIHKSQHGGFLYGAVWNGYKFVGPRYDARAKGLLKRVNKSTVISAEAAAEFGHVNERCVFCSTKIDTPESKNVGYGPVCAARRGLPWG